MKLFYYKNLHGNFGDDLNPWLFDKLFGNIFNESDDTILIGVGTLLNHKVPYLPQKIVFGSGYGYGEAPLIDHKWQFRFVRGPLTAQKLDLPPAKAITDPALLSSLFFNHKDVIKKYKISYMPHCDSAGFGNWKEICELAGLNYIDPRKDYLEVFRDICASEFLITEAMHGAILADAFRVPWAPLKAYPHILESKWADWLLSMDIRAEFSRLKPLYNGNNYTDLRVNLKNNLKRFLFNNRIWIDSWDDPMPRKTSKRQQTAIAENLEKLSRSISFNLSDDLIFNQRLVQLQTEVSIFQNEIIKK